jgi:hypothetical protein
MELSDRDRDKLDELSRSFFVVILLIVAVYVLAEAYAGDDWATIPTSLFVFAAVVISIRGTGGSHRLVNVHLSVMVPAFLLAVAGAVVGVPSGDWAIAERTVTGRLASGSDRGGGETSSAVRCGTESVKMHHA